MRLIKRILLPACIILTAYANTSAQTEVMAWGNITGIRVDGQLMDFETSLRVVGKGWADEDATGKERRTTSYERDGLTQIVNSEIGGFEFTEKVTDTEPATASVAVHIKSVKDTTHAGFYYCIELPEKEFGKATLQFINGNRSSLNMEFVNANALPIIIKASGFIAESKNRKIEIGFDSRSEVYVKRNKQTGNVTVYTTLVRTLREGKEVDRTFSLKATGIIDKSDAKIIMDISNPGNRFAGIGGNFRLQDPQLDPEVIQYCLDNINVAWGRVEMPLSAWQPDENKDPVENAEKGNLNEHVRQSMEMAQKLAARNIPMIISDWSVPAWAILGDPEDAFRFRSKGIYGYQLNPKKIEKIMKSIADYLLYLKKHYGVEPVLFSFNESDLGINVRHTGEEHAEFIKRLGAYFKTRGIKTKLLLGDNSDATTFDFIVPAMKDTAAHQYIGAISFHSWRGCDDATLKKWADSSKKMNLPIIVAEGSTDAAAWNYPQIFSEQPFALYEINLYLRLCKICQPLSILQWQLTSDYSVLTGDGIFGSTGPLRPTRRFWNLKQLASTPVGSFSIPVQSDNEYINCAGFANIAANRYALHIVNNGTGRNAVISGFPDRIKSITVFVTDDEKGMQKTATLQVVNGSVKVELPPASFISLITDHD